MTTCSGFTGVLGLSAQAIAGYGTDHPHDPSDLRRCMEFCRLHNIDTDELRRRMASRTPQWDRLLPEWDNLIGLLQHEMDTRTDGMATRTYVEMQRVLHDGTACDTCNATGRGEDCPKCKGTGRRGGGKCRAPRCIRGADYCPTCYGRGYTVAAKEAS